MKFLKSLTGALVVAAVLAALVWAVALRDSGRSARAQAADVSVEQLIAQKSGLSLDTIHKFEAAGLSAAADKGTTAGVLSSSQATAIRNLVPGPVLDRVFSSAAAAAGVDGSTLATSLENGQSLALVAASKNISRDTLKANLSKALATELATDKTAGLITDQQIPLVTAGFTASLDKIVDYAYKPR